MFSRRGPVVGPLLEAYTRGRRAGPLDLLPWEDGFARRSQRIARALGLTPPNYIHYRSPPTPYVSSTKPRVRMRTRKTESLGENI